MNRRHTLKIFIAAIVARLGLDTMTNPLSIAQDNPDWGRQSAGANIDVLNYHKTISAVDIVGPIQMGNLPYVAVRGISTQALNIGISWFADVAASRGLGNDQIVFNATAKDCFICLPVRGAYTQLTVTPITTPNTVDLDIIATPVEFNDHANANGSTELLSADGIAIGAGATVNLDATTVRAGYAHFYCDVGGGTSWKANLYAREAGAGLHLLSSVSAQSRGPGVLCFIPAMPLRLTVINFEGVGRDITATVTHHPFRL